MTTLSAAAPRRIPDRFLLALGLVLPVLGIIINVVLVWLQRLVVPWYMPGLATLGVALLLLAVGRRRTVWRVVALVFVVLLAGAEWTLLLFATRQPPYTGPVAMGRPFPAFETARADGTPFTQRDLTTGDRSTALVFFRGRW